MRGTASAAVRGVRANAIASATLANPDSSSSVMRVGLSSLSESLRLTASAGDSHSCSTSSTSSCDDSCAAGASAKKKRVSQRLARAGGVTQRAWYASRSVASVRPKCAQNASIVVSPR